MSYKVLVIPEDFTKDEHVLKPVIERILADAGRANPTILVCRDPNFGGIGEAMKKERLRKDVIERYPMVDLFILLLDRDGEAGRKLKAANLETELTADLAARKSRFVAELAWQEVEVFVLAGHDLPDGWSWQQIRADGDVKNTAFQDLVNTMDTGKLPHEGRKKLMAAGIKNWARIKSRCPEDIGSLIERLKPQN
jgi:hypothetical protein